MHTHLLKSHTLSLTLASGAIVLGVVGLAPRTLAPPNFNVQVFQNVAGHTSGFPAAMNDQGVIAGTWGADYWDPLNVPGIVDPAGHTLVFKKPLDSLNFVFGIGKTELVVGASSSFPVAWVGGVPRFLKTGSAPPNGDARDANKSGVICGTVYYDFTGIQVPVMWPNAYSTAIQLPIGSANQGGAFTINDRGWTAGFVMGGSVSNFQAARWESTTQAPTVIGGLPGSMNSEVVSINQLGDTVGRSSFPDFSVQAMLHIRRTNTKIGLGHLGGNYSYANGVNSSRQVVGTSSTSGGAAHAFLWHEGTLYDLNNLILSTSEPILHIANAVAIDDSGRIAAEVVVASPNGPISKMALLTP